MKIFTKLWDGPFPVPKPDLKMKLTVLLLVFTLFQLRAATSYAQKTKITLNMQGVSVLEVIEEIEAITDFGFLYREKDLDLERKVSVKARKKGIEDILETLFKDAPVTYSISDKLIILTKKGNTTSPNNTPTSKEKTGENQQQFEVSGIITDPEGNPLPGVNIIIKGTNQGTMSDPDGKFTILAQTKDILTFSYVGFKRIEIPVNGPDPIDLQMEEDIMSLEGVEVNAGYWKVKDRERTGNISRLTSEEIAIQPVGNVMAAAIGRMPGVNIQQNTGLPGGNFRIRIRGQNSLRSDANEPLYIIDGVPFSATSLATDLAGEIFRTGAGTSPLNTINPSDIESIEVLKDADATAIYGSRGANGVVLITTKRGSVGKTRVDVNFQHGLGKVPHFMDLLNIKQYLEMKREAFANDDAEFRSFDYDVNGAWDFNRDVDWQKRLIGGTSETTNAQLSISGGGRNTQYTFNGGYYRETTVLPGSFAYQRGSGQLNVNHTSNNQNFKANFLVNFSKDKNNLPRVDYTNQALTFAPNAPEPFNGDGSINSANGAWGILGSPFVDLKNSYSNGTDNLITNGVFTYSILPGLELKTNLGYTTTKMNERILYPISAQDPTSIFATGTGQAQFVDSSIHTWIGEPQIEYEWAIGKGHLNILVGTTFQKVTRESKTINATGIGSDALLEDLSVASTIRASNNFLEYRYNAIFGRIHYNWKEKYLINLTGRRDGSSRFGTGNQFGNFGAIGMAWIFSNENFIKNNLPFLSFGKLRSSYGTTGNDQIPDYGYLETYSSPGSYLGGTTLIPARIANQNFSWEVNKKFEVGLELGMFKDRISLSTSYYRNRSSNQLVGFSLPGITGFTIVQANLPAMVQNMGWELELTTRNIQTKDFSWGTFANLTIPRNKLVDYPNLEGSPYGNRYVIGEPLNIAKVYQYLGANQETGEYQFQDVDEDENVSSPNDTQFVKEIGQQYYGGINNSLTYKGLQLDFFFQFVKQVTQSYRNAFTAPGFSAIGGNQPIEVLGRWQQPGDITDIPRFSATNSLFSTSFGSRWKSSDHAYEDTSFIRLKNVSLSWNLPMEVAHKLKLQQARIYIQGQNLLTITNYRGLDPEVSPTSLPPLRVFTTGIQLTF
ncbi:SusC/RagA family TonB-linked outer membrane protein [Sinomicrobium pectinilyticum]|uniref:SusC/RagA family TonB-linked outer membrane protein n=1 Tax=Sinomicrobium pectinilyticum TaxID=1084421 RepID=A0A3N0EJ84_SINP1|nr:TonB-dependent receptor [Sinomicrobium pectinilyticum]RNL87739.1 SusC/RagA family TonB-linked outer membrane protein [Sinomicrobium pectinilyticum]